MLTSIRRHREAAELTQEDVATALGITQAQYSRLETGVVSLKLGTFVHLADIIGFDAVDLLRSERDAMLRAVKEKHASKSGAAATTKAA